MTRPKLHLRDLFWLVLVVACLSGWWIEGRKTADLEERERQVAAQVAANDMNAQITDKVMGDLWKLRGKHPDIDRTLDEWERDLKPFIGPLPMSEKPYQPPKGEP